MPDRCCQHRRVPRERKPLTGRPIPDELRKERGRLIDAMIDVQFKIAQKKVAIHADPDVASSMARFRHELGMEPAIIATGTESKEFVADVQAVASQTGHEIKIISGCDLYELHEAIKRVGVDLLMGNSQAKYIGFGVKPGVGTVRDGGTHLGGALWCGFVFL